MAYGDAAHDRDVYAKPYEGMCCVLRRVQHHCSLLPAVMVRNRFSRRFAMGRACVSRKHMCDYRFGRILWLFLLDTAVRSQAKMYLATVSVTIRRATVGAIESAACKAMRISLSTDSLLGREISKFIERVSQCDSSHRKQ